MAGPEGGQSRRARLFRAALPCLALIALTGTAAQAQTVTPDLFSPTRASQVTAADSPLRRTAAEANDPLNSPKLQDNDKDKPAPSRIGQIPKYGLPAASGASTSGYDSLNRKRTTPKLYPGQPRPKPPVGPGNRAAPVTSTPVTTGACGCRLPPSETANKTPLPPAMAGTVVGQPPRKRLRIDDDPFGAVGDYAGSFLIKSAVELRGGYDTNPGRTSCRGDRRSMWSRRNSSRSPTGSATRSSPTSGAPSPATPTVFRRCPASGRRRRPISTARISSAMSMAVSMSPTTPACSARRDCASRPTIPAARMCRPACPDIRSMRRSAARFGVDQSFNRLQLSAGAAVDRTVYQYSQLTDGTSTSNDDRNYNQYGGLGRVSYDLMPGLKPFGEIEGNVRSHDLLVDRNGFQRNSSGGNFRAGTSFELSRLLTGEVAVGWAARTYEDPRLQSLQGLLTSASLVWVATPLTSAKFFATTSIDETTVPGVSGVLTHTYTAEVDHDFRRWLTAIGKFTWGSPTIPGRRPLRPLLFAVRRPDLQAEPQHLAQGHAAPRLAGFEPARQQHGIDGDDAGREAAALRGPRTRHCRACTRQSIPLRKKSDED